MQNNLSIPEIDFKRKRLGSDSEDSASAPPCKRFQNSLSFEQQNACSSNNSVVNISYSLYFKFVFKNSLTHKILIDVKYIFIECRIESNCLL